MKAVIFDLDGTLADVRHRLHYVRGAKPDWPAFFAACKDDTPHEYVLRLNQMIGALQRYCDEPIVPEIFVCSGRPEDERVTSEKCLEEWGACYDHLLMRASGDYRPDTVVKKEMLDGIRGQGYEVLFAVDDRPSVVAMWRENGVPCFAVDDAEWKQPQAHLFSENEGKTLLTLMVGPSGAGKSSWLQSSHLLGHWWAQGTTELGIDRSHVLSSDQLRRDLLGDVKDQSQNDRVFAALHSVARARLQAGLPTVIDATHLRRKDRLAAVDLAPVGTRVRYVVLDRPLEEKLRDVKARGDEELWDRVVRKHDQTFRSQLKDILAGDGRPEVDVVDLRSVRC